MSEHPEEIDLERIANQQGPDQDQETEQHQDQEPKQQLELSPAEQKAWDQGWRPEDQFEGNPDNWKTADSYILYGEMQEQIRGVKAEASRKDVEHQADITRLNQLHDARQKNAIDNLKAQQRQAAEDADIEAYDRLQVDIDNHVPAAPIQPAVTKDPLIADWEVRNPWINDPNNEKTQQANAFLNVATAQPGATMESALKYVDEQLAKLYPDEIPNNPRREAPTMTEQGKRPSSRGRSRELTMADLNREEMNDWEKFGSLMFKDEKEFLKTVADARKS